MQFSVDQGHGGGQWGNYYEQYRNGNYFDRDGAEDGQQRVPEFAGGHHHHHRGGFHPHGRGRGGRGRGHRGGGHPYNRSSAGGGQNNIGGHKPWITPEILDAIKERNDLQQKAQETNNPDDWSIFKAVRNRTSLLLNDARRLYEEKHGVGVTQTFNSTPHQQQQQSWKSRSSSSFYCDTCDRSFATQELLSEHNAEHVTCKLDGCTFTAHPKVILKHIEMQHSNNLFSRVRGYDTPEDIEKWKDERRAKFPTVDNIKKKQEELDERQKRGERLPLTDSEKFKRWKERRDERAAQIANAKQQQNERKFNNANRGRGARSQHPEKDRQNRRTENYPTDKKSLSDTPSQNSRSTEARPQNRFSENSSGSNSIIVLENFYAHVKVGENGALVGKKLVLWDGDTQRMCQKIARTGLPMKNAEGVSDSEESEGEAEEVDDEITDEDENDFELQTVPSTSSPSHPPHDPLVIPKLPEVNPQESKIPKAVSGLGPLVNYSDDSESDNEPPTELPTDSRKEEGEIDDDEVSEPVPSIPPPQAPKASPAKTVAKSDAVKPNQRGTNQNGPGGPGANSNNKSALASKITKKRRQPRMPKLLKKLLEDDIRRERNQILQVCRFIVQNKFFDEPSSSSTSQSTAAAAGATNTETGQSATNTQD